MIFSWLFVIALSIIVATSWVLFSIVFPAYKKARIQRALVILARSVRYLNEEILASGKIRRGQYIHDELYRFLFTILTHKTNLRLRMIKHIKHDATSNEAWRKFREEIEMLDQNTQEVIREALFSASQILFFRNPLVFIMLLIRIIHLNQMPSRKQIKQQVREKMIYSTEYLTVNAKHDDYELIPITP